jgi:hypothetical protein
MLYVICQLGQMVQNGQSELLWMRSELSMAVTMKIAVISRDTVQFGKNYSI